MSHLKPVDRMYLEKLFEMGGGYVLSFSNNTLDDFVRGSTGEDIYSETYSGRGDSKANRIRAFFDDASDAHVASLLSDLLTFMVDDDKITHDSREADRLRGIVEDLGGEGPRGGASARPSMDRKATAFISYSAEKKEAGAAVKACMEVHGYEGFLAHEDIPVSEEWEQRIREELAGADIFVAVLSKEFKESDWCAQEVGFIVSRPEVLVVPLSTDGTMPYGFISHLQGIKVNRGNLASVLGDVLYRKRPGQVVRAQIERVRGAGSFRGAEAVVKPLVAHFANFTDDEASAFALAAAGNYEVWDAGLCRTQYLPEFLKVNGHRITPEAAEALRGVLG